MSERRDPSSYRDFDELMDRLDEIVAAVRAKDATVAVRESRVALAVGPPDRASAHCDLADAYLLAGSTADAKKEALAALEIAPSFERAQDILLKTIGGAGQ